MRPPTLRDISLASGYSKSTISEALRGSSRIPASTREKILNIAVELGYVADARLTQLMSYLRARKGSHSPAIIAWLQYSPDVLPRRTEPWFKDFWEGASLHALKLGYKLEEFIFNEREVTPKRILQIFRTRGIEGIILAPPWHQEAYKDFIWDGFAVAICGISAQQPYLHMATSGNRNAIHLVMDRIRSAGYRRPGLWLSTYHNLLNRQETAAGFLLNQLNLDSNCRIPWTPTTTMIPLKEWVRINRPDVIICQENTIITSLQSCGIRVPEEVAVVHLNVCSDVADWAGVNRNHCAIGLAAVNLIVGQLNRNERNVPLLAMEVTLPSQWVDGWTLPPRQKKSPTKALRLIKRRKK